MSTNYTAFIKRWNVDTVDQLKSGAQAIAKGQWGYARVDEKAVLRDYDGRFHELMGAPAAYPYMDRMVLTHEPVANHASLPAGEEPGSICLVESEMAVYVYTGTAWVKQPVSSLYADFVGMGAITVTMTTNVGGDVPIGQISHKDTDGHRHIPATKGSATPARVIIDGRTYNTVNIRGTTWLQEDLSLSTNLSGGLGTYDFHTYYSMQLANTAHPDWRVPTVDDWYSVMVQSSDPNASTNPDYHELPVIQGKPATWGDSEHVYPGWPTWENGQNYDFGNFAASHLNITPISGFSPTTAYYWSSETCKRYAGSAYPNGVGYPGYIANAPGNWWNGYWYSEYQQYGFAQFRNGWIIGDMRPASGGSYPPGNANFGLPPPGDAHQPIPWVSKIRLIKKRYDSGSNDGKCLIAKTDGPASEKWDYPNMDMTANGASWDKLTAEQYTDLTDLGDSTSHHHASSSGYVVDVIYSTDFTYAHGLGRNPSVELVDTAGRQIWVEVGYPDIDTVRILCNQPFTGYMRLS